MIVITGATGNVGRPLVESLARNNYQVTAVSRTAPPELPDGVAHQIADLRSPAGLRSALDGADALYLLLPDGGDRLDAAGIMAEVTAAGIRRVVVQSSQAVGSRPGLAAYDVARTFEAAVVAGAEEWTILRPGGFASNAFAWAGQLGVGDTVTAPFADIGLPVVDPADVAAMAAAALTEDGHAGATYVVTGPEPISPREQVRVIAETLGRRLTFVEQSRDEARQAMLAVMPEQIVDSTLTIFGIPTPEERLPSPDVRRVLGRAATPFRDWVSRHAPAFGGPVGFAAAGSLVAQSGQ